MDVALINSVDTTGGVGQYAEQLTRHLDDGITITQYYLNKETRELIRRGPSGKENTAAKATYFTRFESRPAVLLSFFELARAIPQSYDLYHLADQNLAPLCFLPSLSPSIITVHDLVYRVGDVSDVHPLAARAVYYGITAADHVLTVSKSTANDLKQFGYADDPVVIYNGVSDEFQPQSQDVISGFRNSHNLEADRYILSLDADKPRKNIPKTLQVFQQVRGQVSGEIKLLRTKPLNESGDIAFQLGVRDDITVVGPLPWEQLPIVYSIGNALISTSLYEGFGLPPLEAMACGTPVVVSDVASHPEVVGDAGFTHPAHDVDKMAGSLVKLLTSDELLRQYAQRSRRRANEFSWEQCGLNTAREYRQTIQENQRTR